MKLPWRKAAKFLTVLLVAMLVAITASCCVYRRTAAGRLAREVADTPRDATTGIIIGAEPVSLGAGERGVLLLHGFIGSPKDFGDLPGMLAERGFKVRVPLLPGHGTVPQDMKRQSNSSLIEAVEKEYLALRAECREVTVIGFSIGGTLATLLATQGHVPTPEKLVLVCPYFRTAYRWYAVLTPETWHRLLSPALPYLIKGTAFIQIRRREAASQIVSYHVVPREAITDLMALARMAREQSSARLPDQTLLVYSAHDGASSPAQTRSLADRWGIPAERRMVLTNTNHIALWDYEREALCARILEFLR